jgi:ABC-type transporter Mla subunit MlaD
MAEQTIYQELRDSLAEFHQFLADQATTVGPAIRALAGIVPQINDLIDKPIDLLNKLKVEIDKISQLVPAQAQQALEYAQQIKSFVEALRAMLPNESDAIEEVANVADILAGLPTFGQLKEEIKTLINNIITLLQGMKSAP